MNALTVVMALLSALANSAATVLQRRASVDLKPMTGTGAWKALERLLRPLRSPTWWGGASATLASAVFQVLALDNGPLSLVQPLLASELLFALLLGAAVFRRRPEFALWRAFAMLAGGLALFLVAASPSGGDAEASGLQWLVVGCGLACVVGALILTALRLHGVSRAAVLGTATAACFSVTAALIKEVTRRFPGGIGAVLTTWHTYAVAVTGLLSILLLQWTLQSGSLIGSQPALTLGDAMISITLGALLFGERIDLGWHVVIELLAIALMGLGVLGLAGAYHALAGPPEWDESVRPVRGSS